MIARLELKRVKRDLALLTIRRSATIGWYLHRRVGPSRAESNRVEAATAAHACARAHRGGAPLRAEAGAHHHATQARYKGLPLAAETIPQPANERKTTSLNVPMRATIRLMGSSSQKRKTAHDHDPSSKIVVVWIICNVDPKTHRSESWSPN